MRTLNYNNELIYIIEDVNEKDLVTNNLENILKEKKITSAELSKITGISKHRISEIVNKNVIPKIDAALLISHVLNVKLEDIFSVNSFSLNYSILQNDNGDILYINILKNRILTFKEMKSEIKETGKEYYNVDNKKCISKEKYLEIFSKFKEDNFEKIYIKNLCKHNMCKSIARKNTFEELDIMFNKKYKKIYTKLYRKINIYRID